MARDRDALGQVRPELSRRALPRRDTALADYYPLATRPKLSDTDVEQARVMIDMGIPKAEVARTFGVSRQTLYASLRRVAPQ
ncbi:helix-turn-helix domain-containing protein [Micrococcus sp. SIMBA_144]